MAQSISQEAIGATGLPGATAASRHAGATASGAPTTGTFAVGDYVVDQTGAMYVCTVAGTPGTWQLSGVSVNENIAGKNFVINGGMDIWQRGTSFALTGYNVYTADRWSCGNGSGITISQISSGAFNGTSTAVSSTTLTMSSATWNTNAYVGYTVTSGSSTATVTSNTATVLTFSAWTGGTPSTGSFSIVGQISFQYAMRSQRNSGVGAVTSINLFNMFETKNSIPLAGQTISLSFWARAGANFSGTGYNINPQVQTGTGTDQNAWNGWTGSAFPINSSTSLTTSWQKFTYTGVCASNITQAGVFFYYVPTGTAGANDYFDITGVQLEIAPQATPFSRAGGSIGGELALCQRYYWQYSAAQSNSIYGIISSAFLGSSTVWVSQIPFPVPLRIAPSSVNYSTLNFWRYDNTTSAVSSVTLDGTSSQNVGCIYGNMSTALTAGQVGTLRINSSSAYLGFWAEL